MMHPWLKSTPLFLHATITAWLCILLAGCGGAEFFGFEDPQDPAEEEAVEYSDDEPGEEISETLKEETAAETPAPESDEQQDETENDPATEPSRAPAPTVVRTGPQTQLIRRDVIIQKFSTDFETAQQPVDLLFVVDNSYSMDEEIHQVQSNLQGFFQQLATESDVKVGVLSAFQSSTEYNALSWPPEGITAIDQRVRSWNGLYLSSLFIADKLFSSTGVKGSDFFRPHALKVLVMVTDDDSLVFSADEFTTALKQHFSLGDVRFFGFIGLPHQNSDQVSLYPAAVEERLANCDIYGKGKVYYELVAQELQGSLFDICQKDWSPHFEKIAGFVLKAVKFRYPLSHSAESLIAISVDGKAIAMEQVNIEGGFLTFKSGVLPEDRSATVEIQYHKEGVPEELSSSS